MTREALIDTFWYKKSLFSWLLYPISLIYQLIVACRRWILERFFQKTYDIPIIIVGNITVGGVGKTPLVIALAETLKLKGLRVGIVSRGYGARLSHFPHEISLDDDARIVGDEPHLISKRTGCPVVIAPKRIEAVRYLQNNHQVQVIISDDGLQHYFMGRAIEIAVVDGTRMMGNGFCLPAGPLRERINRLHEVDFLVVNGDGLLPNAYRMELVPSNCIQITTGQSVSMCTLPQPLAAVAGIGHPQRFFETLRQRGVGFSAYPFKDHHEFQKEDLCFKEKAIIMTEKDAVKCCSFATDSMYYMPVSASLKESFWHALLSHPQLQGLI